MLTLSTLRPRASSRTKNKRLGRGLGSGKGVFCGRGCKGQKARTGKKIHPLFEGGQTPLHMRLPKLRGGAFSQAKKFAVVHFSDLQMLADKGIFEISPRELHEHGIVRGRDILIKLLSGGELSSKITVSLHAASKTAIDVLQKSGSSLTILS